MNAADGEGTPEVASEDLWRQFFSMGASTPHSWALTATRLGRAARLVLDQVHSAEAERGRLMSASLDPTTSEASREEAEDQLMEALEDMMLFEVAMMLAGFAIENLSKATLIRDDSTLVQNDSLVGNLRTHDLSSLVRRCGVSPTPEQEYVLRILSRQVKWSGRYAVPLSWSDLQKRQEEMLDTDIPLMSTNQIEIHVSELWDALWTGLNSVGPAEVEV